MEPKTVEPGKYFLLDRGTKLVGVVLLTMALVPEFMPKFSIPLGIAAVVIGSATIFMQPDERIESES
ncbi:MAG: hypothetical protein ABEK59_02765 [Halobacteria archaeon]